MPGRGMKFLEPNVLVVLELSSLFGKSYDEEKSIVKVAWSYGEKREVEEEKRGQGRSRKRGSR